MTVGLGILRIGFFSYLFHGTCANDWFTCAMHPFVCRMVLSALSGLKVLLPANGMARASSTLGMSRVAPLVYLCDASIRSPCAAVGIVWPERLSSSKWDGKGVLNPRNV